MKRQGFAYLRTLIALSIAFLAARFAPNVFDFFHQTSEAELIEIIFLISILFVFSFCAFYLPTSTPVPSFVVAMLLGMVAQPLLEPIVHQHAVLNVLVGVGASLILFGGGLETPFGNFKKLFWKIISLSFPGLFITAFLFSAIVLFLGSISGTAISVVVAVLLGAVLSSTDPASIIPILKQLRFHNRDTKDIIISESAMTDVTGTLMTVAFVAILAAGGTLGTLMTSYEALFSFETGVFLLKNVGYGILFGLIGFVLLDMLTRFKKEHSQEFEVDAAYFFFVPLVVFAVTLSLGGSGYLAAFIVGLLYVLSEHLSDTAHFFNHMVDGFLKPIIFLLLGALVDINSMLSYAVIGILAALIFMFVIRPMTVFLTLAPFSLRKKQPQLTLKELLFISFVRETGAIPAALLITIVGAGIPNLDGLLPIGMWVILITLIVQPPLTSVVAKWLGVATDIKDIKELKIQQKEPVVVLGSRGQSFKERLPFVVDWALKHNVSKVILLHCLEDKYTPELAEEIGKDANTIFALFNEDQRLKGAKELNFCYISRTGFLHENIQDVAQNENVALIFVGKRALDYRLREYRQLAVPFYFLD